MSHEENERFSVLADIGRRGRIHNRMPTNARDQGKECPMPPRKIIGVADLNIPGPDTRTLVAQLKAMSDGKRPITADELANVLKCSVGKVKYTLNIANQVGLIRRDEPNHE